MSPNRQDQIQHLPPSQLEPNPFQYRPTMPAETLRELQESIEEHGILQPILVRPVTGKTHQGVYYQVVAGERRWYAAQAAHLAAVPVIIRTLTDSQAAEITLTENIQREDISDYATARGLLALIEVAEREGQKLGVLELQSRLKKSGTWVRNRLNLFKLHPALQAVAETKKDALTSLHYIQKLRDSEQIELFAAQVQGGAPFRQVKEEVDSLLAAAAHRKASQAAPDAQTATQTRADASGGHTTSRGRQFTGTTESEAREQVQRHLAALTEWAPHLSKKDYDTLLVRFAERILKNSTALH